jgi:hypothetical protein
MNSHQNPDDSAAKVPCSGSELKRFKIAAWVVLALSGFVLTMAMTFGNAPRAFVDRMNMVLVPIVAASLFIAVGAVLRFRKSCLIYREGRHSTKEKQLGQNGSPNA